MRLLVALFIPTVAFAGPVFEGYDAYYSTLPAPLFKSSEKVSLKPYSVRPENDVKLAWDGEVEGVRRKLILEKGTIRLDQRVFRMNAAKAFPGETLDAGDLGMGTEAYLAGAHVCLENTPGSASGSAVRHKSVYLIWTDSRPKLFKLPSLFASCRGIRLIDGRPTFDKVEYLYVDGQDQPSGVTFTEYALRSDSFGATGHVVTAKFLELENVYRFTVDTAQK